MSFLIKIISEDHTNDQYILKPMIEKMLERLGKPNAVVELVTDPKLNGYDHAIKQVEKICKKYSFADLILFIPDNDCKQDRRQAIHNLENAKRGEGFSFFAETAIEEIETWLLAGHSGKLGIRWQNVRSDCAVKENIFEPFLAKHGNDNPGNGRSELMRHALPQFNAIKQRSPEIADLMDRIRVFLKESL